MVRDLLIRGMIAGVVAGLLAFGVARVIGEPQVERAIAFEQQHVEAQVPAAHQHEQLAAGQHETASADAHSHGDEELVSRKVQSTIGLLTAVIVYGAAMGGLFALAFAFLFGRVGAVSPRVLALLLAGAGFAALYYVPSLKYPASPPAVGDGADHRLPHRPLFPDAPDLARRSHRRGGRGQTARLAARRLASDAGRRRNLRRHHRSRYARAAGHQRGAAQTSQPRCCGNSAWLRLACRR